MTYIYYDCNIMIMKCLSKILLLFVVATTVIPGDAYSYTDRSTAVLRVLNKAAGKAQTVRVPVENSINFEKLTITARSCKQTDPFDAENHFAFIEISEPAQGQIFGGWMNKNEPGKNPLQNPDYDVWLVACE